VVRRRKLLSPSPACIPLSGTVIWSAPQGEDRGIRGRTGLGTRSADRVGVGIDIPPGALDQIGDPSVDLLVRGGDANVPA
jgi:hypothetical protein